MKQNLRKICEYLEQGLIEREVAVRLSLLSALCGEHILLLGPPGTAKSQLARKLQYAFLSENYFERLLTRFSVPEELFGPLSIKALEEDRYHRLTTHYLPEASIAFIDEIFKANSAILNSLLTLLNEREFDNGSVRNKTPLICVVAASNELPEEEGLAALYDRFLLRYQVQPVSEQGFDRLLTLSDQSDKAKVFDALSEADILKIQQASQSIGLNDSARDLIHTLRAFLVEKEIYISDRRWRKAIKCLQVSAFTNEQTVISQWDCALLLNMLWEKPEQITDLSEWYIDYLNLDVESTITRIEKLVITWENQLNQDVDKHTQKTNTNGELLFRTPQGKTTTKHEHVSLAERDGEVLYLAPPDIEDRTNNGQGYTLSELEQLFFDDNFKQTHIDGRWIDSQNYINNTQNRLVNRVQYEPLVEPYYFTAEYVENQKQELIKIEDDIKLICNDYHELETSLAGVLGHHLWLSGSLLSAVLNNIKVDYPKLVDFQQRVKNLQKLNHSLKIKQATIVQ